MNKLLPTFLVILLLSVGFALKHSCIHDSLPHQNLFTPKSPEGKRMLSSDWEPMRITFEFIEAGPISSQGMIIKEKLINVCTLAIDFLSKNLKVQRLQKNNIFPDYEKCLYTTVPEKYKREGVANSDLHIFIGFFDNPESSTIAYASSCIQDGDTKRPLFGASDYNLSFMSADADAFDFENYFETVVHELTHILGFSRGMFDQFIDAQTGRPFVEGNLELRSPIEKEVINGKDTLWLTTPIVQRMAREHYGCSSLKGLQLENDYGGGSRNSHWEQSTFENEFMNAMHSGHDAVYSKFTFAALEDSGWYKPTYKYLDEVTWGKGQGCDFLYTCDPNKHKEFTNETQFCSFYHNYIGNHYVPENEEDRRAQVCHVFQSVSADCTDIKRNNQDWSGNTFSDKSKCFDSNLSDGSGRSSYGDHRCLEYECTKKGGINVLVNGQKYKIDKETNRVYVRPRGKNTSLEGFIQGPEDWNAFCYIFPKACPKFCSSNGYCVDSQCHCQPNFAGVGCDVYCPDGNYVFQGKCIYTKRCPVNTTLQETSKECLEEKEELSCKHGQVLLDEQCVDECPASYYKGDEYCEYCIAQCEVCNDENTCEQCKTGLILSSDKTQCRECEEGCSTCSRGNCHSCEPGYIREYYDDPLSRDWIMKCVKQCSDSHYKQQRDCLPCMAKNCAKCNSAYECEVCAEGYQRNYQGYCEKLQCYIPNCNVCENNQICSQCKEGYTLKRENGADQCVEIQAVECKPWQYIQNNECQECQYQCYRCSDGNSCDSCYSGYYHDAALRDCVKCTGLCSSCYSASNCRICKENAYLLQQDEENNTCVERCPPGYKAIINRSTGRGECQKE